INGPQEPVVVHGDPVRLIQVVCNLLNNAAKYTEPGGKLALEWGHDGLDGFVRVTDNGRGIPSDVLPKVFDMFVQERVTSDGAGGLGLGLGLVKRLVELHGGTVRATSPGPGMGATFELRLPLVSASIRPSQSKLAANGEPKALRAVVVDDAPD